MASTCTSLTYIMKPNLIAMSQSNQQFWDIFLIKRTVVNIPVCLIYIKSSDVLNMNIN